MDATTTVIGNANAGYLDEAGYVFVMARTDDHHQRRRAPAFDRGDGRSAAWTRGRRGVRRHRRRGRPERPASRRLPRPEGGRGAPARRDRGRGRAFGTRENRGPVAAFKTAVVVERLPKTRSGKILRGTMRRIADGEQYTIPATIDEPTLLDDVSEALRTIGYAEVPVSSG